MAKSNKGTELPAATPAVPGSVFVNKLWTRKFRKAPRCIYFYYIGRDSKGAEVVRQYYYANGDKEIDPEDVDALAMELGRNAIKPDIDQQDPPPTGFGWKGMVWTRKSYLVFLLDVPLDDFEEEPIQLESKLTGQNYSFFDGRTFTVTLPVHAYGRTDPPVACCINHMKKGSGGADLDRLSEPYKLTLNTLLYPLGMLRPDDGGTNMGPPVPPP